MKVGLTLTAKRVVRRLGHVATVAGACWAVTGSLASLSLASESQTPRRTARIHRLHTPVKRRVWVAADSPVVEVSSMTHRPMRLQATDATRVAVRVVNTTIYIDPNADYIHQGANRVDANGIIPAAQRLFRGLNAKPARIIRRADMDRPSASETTSRPVVPHMILMKPPHLTEPRHKSKKIPIPSVPGPPKEKHLRLLSLVHDGGS